jgi:plastin-1
MALINEVDIDGNHTVEFNEFLTLMLRIRAGTAKKGGMSKIIKKTASQYQVKGSGASNAHTQHAFSESEKKAFSEHINFCLGKDPQLQQMGDVPVNPDSMELFTSVRDGLLLCKLINAAVPETIDERALNFPKKISKGLNIYEIKENQNLCINAATAIGCTTVNVHNTDIIEGKPHIILGLIWQIVKIQLLAMINLKNHPEIVRLLEEDEELSDLLKMPADHILLRWFNYHLKNSGSERRVKNFGKDVQDGECYTILLNQIAPNRCDMSALDISDAEDRASKIINDARNKLDVPAFIQPSQLAGGDKRMNLAFCAQIFNTNPGLTVTEEEMTDFANLLDDDDQGDSREERVFRMWINSLGIEDMYVNNLYEDLRDGVVLLRLEDKVQPGIVSWRKVNLNPKNKFKKVANCNYAVVIGKGMKFSLVGIGGVDILDGNKKLILAVVWQLMRRHTLNVLTVIGGGKKADDKLIVKWANDVVASSGKPDSSMRSFRDKTLANGLFLMDLLATINERSINWELVNAGETAEDREANAKYVISVARKLGCCVFLTWEDITEVKPKMMMTFVASIMHFELSKSGNGGAGESKQ